jgi:hypothetical protein
MKKCSVVSVWDEPSAEASLTIVLALALVSARNDDNETNKLKETHCRAKVGPKCNG